MRVRTNWNSFSPFFVPSLNEIEWQPLILILKHWTWEIQHKTQIYLCLYWMWYHVASPLASKLKIKMYSISIGITTSYLNGAWHMGTWAHVWIHFQWTHTHNMIVDSGNWWKTELMHSVPVPAMSPIFICVADFIWSHTHFDFNWFNILICILWMSVKFQFK